MTKAEAAKFGIGKKVLSVGLSLTMISAFSPTSQIQAFASQDDQATVQSAKYSISKHDAKEAVSAAVEEALATIGNLEYLGKIDAFAYKAEIVSVADQANKGIEDAYRSEGIENAMNYGLSAISWAVQRAQAENLFDAKGENRHVVASAACAYCDQVDALTYLTCSEKEALKEAINNEVGTCHTAIDAASSVEEVEAAVSDAEAAMEAVLEEAGAANFERCKTVATEAVETAASNALAEIEALNHLDEEQIAAYESAVNTAKEAAVEAIANAGTISGAELLAKSGELAIATVVSTAEAANTFEYKSEAVLEINALTATANDAIDALENLTDAQKAIYKTEIAKEAAKGFAAVNKTTTDAEAEQAVENAGAALDAILADAENENELIPAREAATEEIDAAAEDALATIDGLAYLNKAEALAHKAQVVAAQAKAEVAIAAADTSDAVEAAKQECLDAIAAAIDDATASNLTKGKIKLGLTLASDAFSYCATIQGEMGGLTDEEKSTYEGLIATEAMAGYTRIDNATTIDELEAAVAEEQQAMEDIFNAAGAANLKTYQDVAIAAINTAAENALAKIAELENTDENPHGWLDADRIAELNAEITAARDAAIEAIESAGTPVAVEAAKVEGGINIDAIVASAQVENIATDKNLSVETLKSEVASAKEKIDALENLTDLQKTLFKAQVDAAAIAGVIAIETSTTAEAVDESFDKYDDALSDALDAAVAKDLENAKEAGNEALTERQATIADELEGLTNLTDEEKEAYLEQANAAIEAGSQAVEAATTSEEAQTAASTAIDNVNAVIESAKAANKDNRVAIYRLYNAATSEHLWTASETEYNTLPDYGWTQEGVTFTTNVKGGKAVYRLYNEGLGQHVYSSSASEIQALVDQYGWTLEGDGEPCFYSVDETVETDAVSVYRLYNDAMSQHMLSISESEVKTLVDNYGWSLDGIAFYAFKAE